MTTPHEALLKEYSPADLKPVRLSSHPLSAAVREFKGTLRSLVDTPEKRAEFLKEYVMNPPLPPCDNIVPDEWLDANVPDWREKWKKAPSASTSTQPAR